MTNYSLALIAVVLFLFASSSQSPTSYSTSRQTSNTAPSKTSKPSILFDDFNYTNKDQLKKHGWILRKAPGWPGVPGANWSEDGVSIVLDPDRPGNRILRMTSSTDGTGAKTKQTQICHQRKYLEGTYAARVRFNDNPVLGPGGDQIVEWSAGLATTSSNSTASTSHGTAPTMSAALATALPSSVAPGYDATQREDNKPKISDAAAGMFVPGPKIAATPASRNSS